MAILEIKDVEFTYRSRYQTVHALRGINCSFETGKFYALVGSSGSGKSTLLSLMAGLSVPDSGEILFEGESTGKMDLADYRLKHAAVIYQSFRLLPLLTVQENITFPMELRGVKGKEARKRAAELVKKVNLPETVLNRFPVMLSGGEQQRVAIARAMTMDSRLMLADEPTGNLDSENTEKIIDLLMSLAHDDGYAVIVVTHDMEVADRADEVLRMKDGVIERLYDRYKSECITGYQ